MRHNLSEPHNCLCGPCCCLCCCAAAAGASYEVTDPDKGNPAQIAAYWGHLEAVVKLVEAGCSWPHGKTARGVAGGDVVKWICNITTNKVRGDVKDCNGSAAEVKCC